MGAHLVAAAQGLQGQGLPVDRQNHFVCVEGEGSTKIDGKVFMGSEGRVRHPVLDEIFPQRQKEWVLFQISDRPAQEALGIWREKI